MQKNRAKPAREYNISDIVRVVAGPEPKEPTYKMSNGRQFYKPEVKK